MCWQGVLDYSAGTTHSAFNLTRTASLNQSRAIGFALGGVNCFLTIEDLRPVTTKAQQKAENANSADNAETNSAILLGFLRKQ